MNNENRRKLLLGGFAAMVALTLGDYALRNFYDAPLEAAQSKVERATRELGEKMKELKRLNKEQAQLDKLRAASLPADVETARTLYLGWLNELAAGVELVGRQVDSNPPRSLDGYRILPFSLRCRGTLEQLTELLFRFYQAPHLHNIRTMTITPIAGERLLSLSLAIEAVSIDGSRQTDALASGQADRLAGEALRDYRSIIARNLFSTSGGVQAEQFTTLTAVVEADGYQEAWFTNSLDGETSRVRAGDRLRIGSLEGTVESISLRDLILEVDGTRWLMTIDDRLADATALPPEH